MADALTLKLTFSFILATPLRKLRVSLIENY